MNQRQKVRMCTYLCIYSVLYNHENWEGVQSTYGTEQYIVLTHVPTSAAKNMITTTITLRDVRKLPILGQTGLDAEAGVNGLCFFFFFHLRVHLHPILPPPYGCASCILEAVVVEVLRTECSVACYGYAPFVLISHCQHARSFPNLHHASWGSE